MSCFCTSMVKVCFGSQAESPLWCIGKQRLGVFGQATWRTQDLLENDVGLCRAWYHGKQEVWGHFYCWGPQWGLGTTQLCTFTKTLAWLYLWPPERGCSRSLSSLCSISKTCFRKRKHNSKRCCQTQKRLVLYVESQRAQLRCNLHCEWTLN